VTVSIGVASIPGGEHNMGEKAFFACADRALYLSKQRGRDRSMHFASLAARNGKRGTVTSIA